MCVWQAICRLWRRASSEIWWRPCLRRLFFAGIIRRRKWIRNTGEPLILRCVCGTLGILCNFYAIDHLLVADASILNKLSPFFRDCVFFSAAEREDKTGAGGVCGVSVYRMSVRSEAGISQCGIGSGADRSLRRTGSRHCIYYGACARNAWGEKAVIVFYFSLFSCLAVVPWLVFHFTPMTMKQLVTLLMAGLFAAGGQFTITAAYTYAPAGKISIFDYSQIIFATLLGFLLFGKFRISTALLDMGLLFWHRWECFFII